MGPDGLGAVAPSALGYLLAACLRAGCLQAPSIGLPAQVYKGTVERFAPSILKGLSLHTCAVLNGRIRQEMAAHPMLKKLHKDTFFMGSNRSNHKQVKMAPRSGAITFALSQVIVGCLLGYDTDRELLRFRVAHFLGQVVEC